MKYIVNYNKYDKKLDTWHDIKRVFNNMVEAIEFMAKLEKLREWESVSITAAK